MSFPEAFVTDHHLLIPSMTNQEKDCHVLAAAVKAGAQVIVTTNLKDSPPSYPFYRSRLRKPRPF